MEHTNLEHQETLEGRPAARWRATIGIVTAAISAYVIWTGLGYGAGSKSNPGAGAFPLLAGSLGLLSSVIVVVESLMRSTDSVLPMESFTRAGLARMTLFIGALVLFPLLLERLGFFVAATVCCTFIAKLAGNPRWLIAVATALVLTTVTYLGAIYVLGVHFLPSL